MCKWVICWLLSCGWMMASECKNIFSGLDKSFNLIQKIDCFSTLKTFWIQLEGDPSAYSQVTMVRGRFGLQNQIISGNTVQQGLVHPKLIYTTQKQSLHQATVYDCHEQAFIQMEYKQGRLYFYHQNQLLGEMELNTKDFLGFKQEGVYVAKAFRHIHEDGLGCEMVSFKVKLARSDPLVAHAILQGILWQEQTMQEKKQHTWHPALVALGIMAPLTLALVGHQVYLTSKLYRKKRF